MNKQLESVTPSQQSPELINLLLDLMMSPSIGAIHDADLKDRNEFIFALNVVLDPFQKKDPIRAGQFWSRAVEQWEEEHGFIRYSHQNMTMHNKIMKSQENYND